MVLILIGAFAFLLLDLRMEHADVLSEELISYMPLVYSGLMVILSLIAVYFWESWGRKVLFWAFALAIVVGVVGFWQHNEHKFGQRMAYVFTVWGESGDEKSETKKTTPEKSEQNGAETGRKGRKRRKNKSA